MISIMGLVLVIGIGFLAPKAAAQSDKYPTMASSPFALNSEGRPEVSGRPSLLPKHIQLGKT